jgi:hypothetical protein
MGLRGVFEEVKLKMLKDGVPTGRLRSRAVVIDYRVLIHHCLLLQSSRELEYVTRAATGMHNAIGNRTMLIERRKLVRSLWPRPHF